MYIKKVGAPRQSLAVHHCQRNTNVGYHSLQPHFHICLINNISTNKYFKKLSIYFSSVFLIVYVNVGSSDTGLKLDRRGNRVNAFTEIKIKCRYSRFLISFD